MSRTFVIGDIHGAFKALVQCLERSEFDYEHDKLICLGDVCDGWPEVKDVMTNCLRYKIWFIYSEIMIVGLSNG
ncbi:MAG: hypothetical protein HC906_10500 [Bacteroidales bacterium]|nr:hypothetical protein [Bacteroidales bacterium]